MIDKYMKILKIEFFFKIFPVFARFGAILDLKSNFNP